MGDNSVAVRIPPLEILATQYGGAFARSSRELSSQERILAQSVFGQSINLNVIKIVSTTVINDPAVTLGNNIRIPPGSQLSPRMLIHELTHVWQYQTRGNSYISDSLFHQSAAAITKGSRERAYDATIVPGQSIHLYTAEQQARIVEDYYSNPTLQTDRDYIRLIAEVRRARPVLTDMDRYQESLYGPGYQNTHLLNLMPGTDSRQGITVLRIEF